MSDTTHSNAQDEMTPDATKPGASRHRDIHLGDVDAPDGPVPHPGVASAPWRRRGHRDRRDAGTWRRSASR